MALDPQFVAIIERLLNPSGTSEEAGLLEELRGHPEALEEYERAKRVDRLLRRDAARITPSETEIEQMKSRLRNAIQVGTAGSASAATENSGIMGNAVGSLLTWLSKFTDRVTAMVQTKRVFALGSLGGENGAAVCEVPLEHPDVNGSVVVRRVDAVHLEMCVNVEGSNDPGLAVVLRDGAKQVLKPNTPLLINTDMLPRKGLAPPTLEFTLQKDVSE